MVCSKCRLEVLELPRLKYGDLRCRVCVRAARKTPAHYRAQARYRAAHKDRIKEYQRQYWADLSPEKRQTYKLRAQEKAKQRSQEPAPPSGT